MANKKPLPNGCSYSLSVHPANWQSKKANPKISWHIFYRFYEPGKEPYRVFVRGMNEFKALSDKQAISEQLLADEIRALESGYNPNKKEIIRPVNSEEISPTDTLEFSLNYALQKSKLDKKTFDCIKSNLKGFLTAAKILGYDNFPVGEIRRKHIITILEKCESINPKFSDYTYNRYRTDMMILFKELVKREAIEANPVDNYLEPRKLVKKIKKLLTKEERQKLHSLKETHYTFWRFINIFYHSSRRITEMLGVKKEHVNLKEQKFQVLMKKGKTREWIWATIEDNALPFWQEIISEANSGDYLFAEGLKPGKRNGPIRTDQIKRRWHVHVQIGLGIKQGIYILKHTHLDLIASEGGIKAAQEAAGHKTPVITMIYATGEAEREHNRRKSQGGEL